MLSALKVILAYLGPLVAGYIFLSLLDRKHVLAVGYKLSAGALLGIGIFTMEIFALGILGLKLGLIQMLGILALDLAILEIGFFVLEKKLFLPSWKLNFQGFKNFSVWSWIILLILILKILSSFYQVTHVPTFEFDAWNNWNLRAKVIYAQQQIPLDKTDPFYLGGGIKSYPLNDALWKVWQAQILGGWLEQWINTYSVFYYLILLSLFYFTLSEKIKTPLKILFTYLLAGLPFLYFHSWVAYADLEFVAYLFLVISAFVKYLQANKKIYLYISALGLALAIWTKNEGFAVVLPTLFGIAIIYAIAKQWSIRDFLNYWLIALIAASPWLIFRFANHLDVLSGDSSSFHLMFNSQFLREAFYSVFLRSHFNFLGFLALGLLIFRIKSIWQRTDLKYLALTSAILFLFYNAIIIFTDKAYDLSALVRVNLQIAPVVWLLVVLILSDFRELQIRQNASSVL